LSSDCSDAPRDLGHGLGAIVERADCLEDPQVITRRDLDHTTRVPTKAGSAVTEV
jgi:hypothetical protein